MQLSCWVIAVNVTANAVHFHKIRLWTAGAEVKGKIDDPPNKRIETLLRRFENLEICDPYIRMERCPRNLFGGPMVALHRSLAKRHVKAVIRQACIDCCHLHAQPQCLVARFAWFLGKHRMNAANETSRWENDVTATPVIMQEGYGEVTRREEALAAGIREERLGHYRTNSSLGRFLLGTFCTRQWKLENTIPASRCCSCSVFPDGRS